MKLDLVDNENTLDAISKQKVTWFDKGREMFVQYKFV